MKCDVCEQGRHQDQLFKFGDEYGKVYLVCSYCIGSQIGYVSPAPRANESAADWISRLKLEVGRLESKLESPEAEVIEPMSPKEFESAIWYVDMDRDLLAKHYREAYYWGHPWEPRGT